MSAYRRKPSVSGIFYSSDKEQLLDELKGCFTNKIFGPGRLPPSDEVRKNLWHSFSPRRLFYSGSVAAMVITAFHHLNLITLFLSVPIIMAWDLTWQPQWMEYGNLQ